MTRSSNTSRYARRSRTGKRNSYVSLNRLSRFRPSRPECEAKPVSSLKFMMVPVTETMTVAKPVDQKDASDKMVKDHAIETITVTTYCYFAYRD